MPMYTYVDKNTKKTVDVLRRISEYETVPDRSETKDILTDKEHKKAKWERKVGSKDQIVIGFGMKGNW